MKDESEDTSSVESRASGVKRYRIYVPCALRKEGYTLLELMISITMISLIVLILGGAMRLGFRSVDSGERRIESLERFKTSLGIMNSQIQSGIPLTYNDNGAIKYSFRGDRELLQFSTNRSLWDAQRGYIEVAYKVISDDYGKQTLSISEKIVGSESKQEVRLFDPCDTIYFEYFVKDPTEEKGKWVDRWTDSEEIPGKVKLNIVNGSKRLTFIIPMRVRGGLTKVEKARNL